MSNDISMEDLNEKNAMNDSVDATLLPPFSVHEKVECCDTDKSIWYDAVVKKIKYDSIQQRWLFLIHFQGWNSRYDQWQTPDSIRIPSQNTTNEAHDAPNPTIQTAAAAAAAAAAATTNANPPQTDTVATSKKRNHPSGTSASDTPRKRRSPLTQYCALPFTLKTVLVDEWDCLHRSKLLHVLPAPVPLRKVFQHFLKRKSASADAEIATTMVQGLTDLWTSALPTILLYPAERPQYQNIVLPLLAQHPDWELLDVYGAEFLLRLYVRLPTLLAQWPLPKHNSSSKMGPFLQELLVVLQKNRTTLFTAASYRAPPPTL